MNIRTYTNTGTRHLQIGKTNEDSIITFNTNGYLFCVISDGAGCSKHAKTASLGVTFGAYKFFSKKLNANAKLNFDTKLESIGKSLIFSIQRDLRKIANAKGIDFNELMSTLILLCIDISKNKYYILHIGDGIIAQRNEKIDIISFPENGLFRNSTFFVNSEDVIAHARYKMGELNDNSQFILATDGCYEDCYDEQEYMNRLLYLTNGLKNNYTDDATLCIIN